MPTSTDARRHATPSTERPIFAYLSRGAGIRFSLSKVSIRTARYSQIGCTYRYYTRSLLLHHLCSPMPHLSAEPRSGYNTVVRARAA